LQHHHRRRRRCIFIVFFFSNINKKVTTACYYRLFRCNNTTQENNPKKMKRREGAYLQVLTLPSQFWLPLQTRCPSCHFWLLVLFSRFKFFRALTMEWVQNEVR
jgi:hypothetical protein